MMSNEEGHRIYRGHNYEMNFLFVPLILLISLPLLRSFQTNLIRSFPSILSFTTPFFSSFFSFMFIVCLCFFLSIFCSSSRGIFSSCLSS